MRHAPQQPCQGQHGSQQGHTQAEPQCTWQGEFVELGSPGLRVQRLRQALRQRGCQRQHEQRRCQGPGQPARRGYPCPVRTHCAQRRCHSRSIAPTQEACGSGHTGAAWRTAPGASTWVHRALSAGLRRSSASTVGSPQTRMSALRACATGDCRKLMATSAASRAPALKVGTGGVARVKAPRRTRCGDDLVEWKEGGLKGAVCALAASRASSSSTKTLHSPVWMRSICQPLRAA